MTDPGPGGGLPLEASEKPADCPFCPVDPGLVVAESRFGIAFRDEYPASPGHTLVIPRAHVSGLWDLEPDARADLWALVGRARAAISEEHSPDGFNIGINDGTAAGQTVDHAHIHVIPRYAGDVADPRGGMRWVVPDQARYWLE